MFMDVYGGPGDRSNSLREWRALSLAAPSLELKFTGNPAVDRYPFSVKPDRPVALPMLMEVMRDSYAGTQFDLTAQECPGHDSARRERVSRTPNRA